MPLTLVLGPANSAKAGEVLGAYANAVARRDALLVVPTSADAAHYDRELAASGVILGRALTFEGLLAEIARRAGFVARRLTALQRERLLRGVLAGASLDAFARSARGAGFPGALGRLFAEFGQDRVTAGRLAAALRAWAGEDDDRAAYGHDLAALFGAYVRALERSGRVDAAGYAWGALDALRAAPDRWGGTPVYFYGFDDLTPVEHDAIETLAERAGVPVTVSLTYEGGRGALAARATSAEQLRGWAATVRGLPALEDHYTDAARAALHRLERGLFEPPREPIDPGEAVVLMEAGGERAEAELIAAEVLSALREGVPVEEIVVVCRSLTRSGALLERTLARYGVGVSSARTVQLGHTGLGRALLALARVALLPEAPFDDVLTWLRFPGGPLAVGDLDGLEVEARRRGLATAAAALALLEDGAAGGPVAVLAAVREAADPAVALGGAARSLLSQAHLRQAPVLDTDEERDARAAARVLAALDELAELGGPPLPAAELIALLEGLAVAADPPRTEGVLVAEPLSIRARRFRRVFVCGLVEGEFPARSEGDPFLGEDRRRELALASGLVVGAGEPDGLAGERYLLYACVSRATERLCLSYRSSDEEGNLVLPSPFLADIADLFVPEWRERRRRRLLADVVWPAGEAPTARELALAEASLAPAAEPPSLTRRLSEAALAHVRHRDLLSGGALESFAGCPVDWLVKSQLQPEELGPDPEPLTRGSFMHDVLERVIGRLEGPVTFESLPRAEGLLDEIVASGPPAELAAGRPEPVRRAILRGIEADLRRYLRHEAGDGCAWVPEGLERRFGFDDAESLPPLVLGEGDEAVRVRGVIDRIDIEPGGRRAIVRDYKSGSVRGERCANKWRDEHQLQVALYMLAARRLLSLEPVGGFYQPLTGPSLRPRGAFVGGTEVGRCAYGNDGLPQEELEALLADLEAQALEVAATLRRGELTPSPESCGRDGCRHPGICWAA